MVSSVGLCLYHASVPAVQSIFFDPHLCHVKFNSCLYRCLSPFCALTTPYLRLANLQHAERVGISFWSPGNPTLRSWHQIMALFLHHTKGITSNNRPMYLTILVQFRVSVTWHLSFEVPCQKLLFNLNQFSFSSNFLSFSSLVQVSVKITFINKDTCVK